MGRIAWVVSFVNVGYEEMYVVSGVFSSRKKAEQHIVNEKKYFKKKRRYELNGLVIE